MIKNIFNEKRFHDQKLGLLNKNNWVNFATASPILN